MDSLDPFVLARIQFAANITFHILFPTISIAMGWVLLFFKTRFIATAQQHWMDAYQFWVKVFALTFALGVVSGITKPAGVCIQEFSARIQKADMVVPNATKKVASVCTFSLTRPRPNSMMPSMVASKKNAVSTS